MNDDNNQKPMSVVEIAVNKISANPYQPRKHFDDEKLSSLADSIRQYGVMQPIVVTKKGDEEYELISGERRWRASKIAGKETIPAVVREYDHSNEEKFELAIIENVQREDLNPVDKAKAFKKLTEEFGLTHSQIASKVGKSREYISNSLRILVLPDSILDVVARGDISEGHAKPLLMLNDRPFEQQELLKKIMSNNLTVRASIQAVRNIKSSKNKNNNSEVDPEIKIMEKKLAEKLGTKVCIDEKIEGEGGKLTIEYFSKEDLEKIINLVRGKGLSSAPILEESSFVDNFNDNFNLEESNKKELKHFAVEFNELADDKESVPKEKESDTFHKKDIDDKSNDNDLDGFKISFEKGNYSKIDKSDDLEEVSKDGGDLATEIFKEQKEQQEENNIINNFDINNISEHVNLENQSNSEIIKGSFIEENNNPLNSFSEEEKEKNSQSTLENNYTAEIEKDTNEEKNETEYLKKSEAQKKIDAILAGKSTVSEIYSNINSENNSEADNLKEDENLSENKDKVSNNEEVGENSIYQQFLESKKKIEEQKARIYQNEKRVGVVSDSGADFLNAKQSDKINQSANESPDDLFDKEDHSSPQNNFIDEPEIDKKIEGLFIGDSFIKDNMPESSHNDKEDGLKKNNNNSNLKSEFGSFSI